jgi:ELWxxDGT repeat protein
MTLRRSFLALVVLLALSSVAQAGTASLVKDIQPDPADVAARDANPSRLVTVGDKLFFQTDGEGRSEMWVTDGTALGTELVAAPREVVGRLGNALILLIRDEDEAIRLWRTDGTRAGTLPLTGPEVRLDVFGSFSSPLLGRDRLYFTGCTETVGCEPWVSDGTAAGTRLIRELEPGGETGANAPEGYVEAGDRVFFLFRDALWRTDGTAAGTVPVRTFGFNFNPPSRLTPLGNRLFFILDTGAGQELWVSDGTDAGTRALTDFAAERALGGTNWLKPIGNRLYFRANDVLHGDELWRSDGTSQGTVRVTDFGFFTPFDSGLEVDELEEIGGRLIFPANDGLSSDQLWTTTGNPESTAPLCAGAGCPGYLHLFPSSGLLKLGGRVLFGGTDREHGLELWVTDGTARGTTLTRDVCPGSCPGFFSQPRALAGAAFYVASPRSVGSELWRTDGTGAGTRRFADAAVDSGSPLEVAALGRRVFFAARDSRGRELWRSEGRAGTTRQVVDLGRNRSGSNPGELLALGDRLLFVACSGELHGEQLQLWSSAGNEASTQALPFPPVSPCFGSRAPQRLTAAGGTAFFWSTDFIRSTLWASDGTVAGTRPLRTSSSPGDTSELAALGSRVFFGDGEGGPALWTSDGTAEGTRAVVGLPGLPDGLTALGSEAYFTTSDGRTGELEVWRTDGTAAGTQSLGRFTGFTPVTSFTRAGAAVYFFADSKLWRTDGSPGGTVAVTFFDRASAPPVSLGGRLFFLGNGFLDDFSEVHGLWTSDGTAAGTRLLLPTPRDSRDDSGTASIEVLGNAVYFTARDAEHGRELWKSDGTPGGTVLVRDLVPGPLSSHPSELTVAAGRLYFRASDRTHGSELWQSDGTRAGTRLVQDLNPSLRSASPEQLTVAGSQLFFVADDGLSGREPWVLPLGVSDCQPSATRLCLNSGRFQVESTWRDFAGNTGVGHAFPLSGDTGYFWFFDPANVELVTKVLDAEALNQHFWVFYGALSSVEYTLTVTDTQTGATRRYLNNSGELASVGDTQAFGPLGAAAQAPVVATAPLALISERSDPAAKAACVPDSRRLCLNGGRFAVESTWKDFQNHTGAGTAVGLTGDTGYFWFFDPANVEVVLKVLDGRGLNGKFWTFYGALSNVEYNLTVTDTQTGAVRTYANPSGRFASDADTGAF